MFPCPVAMLLAYPCRQVYAADYGLQVGGVYVTSIRARSSHLPKQGSILCCNFLSTRLALGVPTVSGTV